MLATHSGDVVLEDKLQFSYILSLWVFYPQEACMPLWCDLASKPEHLESDYVL